MLEKKKTLAPNTRESAVIIGVINPSQSEERLSEYLDELEFLADTAGADIVKRFAQKLDKPNPKTLLGSGKINQGVNQVKKRAGVITNMFFQ